jgi:hypothetical protein
MTLAMFGAGAAQGYLMVNIDIVAQLRGLADHNTETMVDDQPPAELGRGMDLNSCEKPAQMRDKTPQSIPAALPEPAG